MDELRGDNMNSSLTRTEQRFIQKLLFDYDIWDKLYLRIRATEDGFEDYFYDAETGEEKSVRDVIVDLYEMMLPYEHYETPYMEIYKIECLMKKYGHNIQNYTYGLSDEKYAEELERYNGNVLAIVNMVGSHKCAGNPTIGAREWVACICDQVEDLLEAHGVRIPDDGRTSDEGEACLYGEAYDVLSCKIDEILTELVLSVKENPNCEFDFSNWE